jgi:hypothetical protein
LESSACMFYATPILWRPHSEIRVHAAAVLPKMALLTSALFEWE